MSTAIILLAIIKTVLIQDIVIALIIQYGVFSEYLDNS